MDRSLIDRWADTTAFRLVLLLASLGVVPVLALGVLMTAVGGAALLFSRSGVELEQAIVGLVSCGGALGFLGYVRAHAGARNPRRHNVTATLLCLAAGVAAALGVAGYSLNGAARVLLASWDGGLWAALFALFGLANVVWALSGVAWMQRLLRRYAQSTGEVFDTVPVVLLFEALALATAAAVSTALL